MEWKALTLEGYDRITQSLEESLKGLTLSDLKWQPHRECNSIGWTAWHLTRVQDAQIADLMCEDSLWIKDRWYEKFKRTSDPDDTGYGHTPEQVAAFESPGVKVLLEHHRAVTERSKRYIASLTAADLDRVLDEPWFQPLPTVGVRLVSVMADGLEHAGEVSYIRGLLKAKG